MACVVRDYDFSHHASSQLTGLTRSFIQRLLFASGRAEEDHLFFQHFSPPAKNAGKKQIKFHAAAGETDLSDDYMSGLNTHRVTPIS